MPKLRAEPRTYATNKRKASVFMYVRTSGDGFCIATSAYPQHATVSNGFGSMESAGRTSNIRTPSAGAESEQ